MWIGINDTLCPGLWFFWLHHKMEAVSFGCFANTDCHFGINLQICIFSKSILVRSISRQCVEVSLSLKSKKGRNCFESEANTLWCLTQTCTWKTSLPKMYIGSSLSLSFTRSFPYSFSCSFSLSLLLLVFSNPSLHLYFKLTSFKPELTFSSYFPPAFSLSLSHLHTYSLTPSFTLSSLCAHSGW